MSMDTLEQIETFSLDLGDLACQFKHDHGAVPAACRTCLVEVTHIAEASCGRESIHLCDAAAAAVTTFIAAGKVTRCATCKQPPFTHWTVRMI